MKTGEREEEREKRDNREKRERERREPKLEPCCCYIVFSPKA